MIQCALSGPAKTRAHIVKAPVSNPHFDAGFAAQKQGESGKLTRTNSQVNRRRELSKVLGAS